MPFTRDMQDMEGRRDVIRYRVHITRSIDFHAHVCVLPRTNATHRHPQLAKPDIPSDEIRFETKTHTLGLIGEPQSTHRGTLHGRRVS